jgi:hypothetical protein
VCSVLLSAPIVWCSIIEVEHLRREVPATQGGIQFDVHPWPPFDTQHVTGRLQPKPVLHPNETNARIVTSRYKMRRCLPLYFRKTGE